MEADKIKEILMENLMLKEVYVTGDGNHFQVVAISTQFTNMSRLKKQQIIYAPLMKYISNNCIHALSIKAYTPEEWNYNRKLTDFKVKD